MEDELGMQECETLRVFEVFHASFQHNLPKCAAEQFLYSLPLVALFEEGNMCLETQQCGFGAFCRTRINKLRFAQRLHHDVFVNRLNRRPFHLPRTRLMMKLSLSFTTSLAKTSVRNVYPAHCR